MSATVKDVTLDALKLLGHGNRFGMVDENREARFFGAAVSYANRIQNEILMRENYYRNDNPAAFTDNGDGTYTALPRPSISAITDTFVCSDDSVDRVVPTGMAVLFAALDGDTDNYSRLAQEYYGNLLPTVVAADEPIEDYYGTESDPDFQQ